MSHVTDIARGWLCTPYHHRGRIKGVGVDCLMLLCEVFEDAGLVPHIDPGPYPMDWMLHRDEERYLAGLEQYCDRVDGTPEMDDIVLYRFGRCASHAGIVTIWPEIVHACRGQGVVLGDGQAGELAGRLDSVWRVRPAVKKSYKRRAA
jgi:cell wall-associated NlpC family hydrolase